MSRARLRGTTAAMGLLAAGLGACGTVPGDTLDAATMDAGALPADAHAAGDVPFPDAGDAMPRDDAGSELARAIRGWCDGCVAAACCDALSVEECTGRVTSSAGVAQDLGCTCYFLPLAACRARQAPCTSPSGDPCDGALYQLEQCRFGNLPCP